MLVGESTRKTAGWDPCCHEGLANEAISMAEPLFPASLPAAGLGWKGTKPSRLPTVAHASRVILPSGRNIGPCLRLQSRGDEGQSLLPAASLDQAKLPTAEFGMSTTRRQGRVGVGEGPEELFWKHVTHTTQRRRRPTLPSLPRYLGVIVRSARLTRRLVVLSS